MDGYGKKIQFMSCNYKPIYWKVQFSAHQYRRDDNKLQVV